MDEIYDAIFVKPIFLASRDLLWRIFDMKVIDGLVNGIANFFYKLSQTIRKTQTGFVRNYAMIMVLGVVAVISVWFIVLGD